MARAATRSGHDFDGDVVMQGWDVTKSVICERRLELRAHRDPLTGVANRSAFMTRLDRELAMSRLPSSDVAVFCADVDGFKRVNEAYGHETGDRVLVEMAGRLQASLRPGDLLARMGGDEFAIICPNLIGWPTAATLIQRLRSVVAEPIDSPEDEIRVRLSLGAAFADELDGRHNDAAALLARAGERMLREKPGRDEAAGRTPRFPMGLR